MNTEQERAEFEAWCLRQGPALLTHVWAHNPDSYFSDYTQAAWEAWQARAALQSQEYTPAIGEAGQEYMDKFEHAYPLPALFRWRDLWSAMCSAANKGRVQSQDREDAERYRWLCNKFGITKLPCAIERIIAFEMYVADGKASIDEAIDHARRAEGEGE